MHLTDIQQGMGITILVMQWSSSLSKHDKTMFAKVESFFPARSRKHCAIYFLPELLADDLKKKKIENKFCKEGQMFSFWSVSNVSSFIHFIKAKQR